MKKKAESAQTSAKALIAGLDRLTKENKKRSGVVELVTDMGDILSWQKHKLRNLEFFLERGTR